MINEDEVKDNILADRIEQAVMVEAGMGDYFFQALALYVFANNLIDNEDSPFSYKNLVKAHDQDSDEMKQLKASFPTIESLEFFKDYSKTIKLDDQLFPKHVVEKTFLISLFLQSLFKKLDLENQRALCKSPNKKDITFLRLADEYHDALVLDKKKKTTKVADFEDTYGNNPIYSASSEYLKKLDAEKATVEEELSDFWNNEGYKSYCEDLENNTVIPYSDILKQIKIPFAVYSYTSKKEYSSNIDVKSPIFELAINSNENDAFYLLPTELTELVLAEYQTQNSQDEASASALYSLSTLLEHDITIVDVLINKVHELKNPVEKKEKNVDEIGEGLNLAANGPNASPRKEEKVEEKKGEEEQKLAANGPNASPRKEEKVEEKKEEEEQKLAAKGSNESPEKEKKVEVKKGDEDLKPAVHDADVLAAIEREEKERAKKEEENLKDKKIAQAIKPEKKGKEVGVFFTNLDAPETENPNFHYSNSSAGNDSGFGNNSNNQKRSIPLRSNLDNYDNKADYSREKEGLPDKSPVDLIHSLEQELAKLSNLSASKEENEHYLQMNKLVTNIKKLHEKALEYKLKKESPEDDLNKTELEEHVANYDAAYNAAAALSKALASSVLDYMKASVKNLETYNVLKTTSQAAIRTHKPVLADYRDNGLIIANVVGAIFGLGIFYGVVLLGNYLFNNFRNTFWHTDGQMKVDDYEESLNEVTAPSA